MSNASFVIRCMGGAAPRNAFSTRMSKLLPVVRPQLPVEHEPSVAEQDIDFRLAVSHEREVPARKIEHGRIELVVANRVALAPERRDHAGAEPDDADAQRRLRSTRAAFGVVRNGETQAAALVEAADRLHLALGALELAALVDARLHEAEAVLLSDPPAYWRTILTTP